jgi:hypothetical protein
MPRKKPGRCGGEGKNSQPPPGIEPYNPHFPARSLVAIPTELSWPQYKNLERVNHNLFEDAVP